MSYGGMNPPLRYKLHLGFFMAALTAQIIAPRVPAFDTSHLILSSSHTLFAKNSQIQPLLSPQKPSFAQPGTSPVLINDNIPELAARLSWLIPFPGLRWDALHFLDVAMNGGYVYEHQYAFSPGIPLVLRLVYELKLRASGLFFQNGGGSTYLGSWVNEVINAFLVSLLACQACLSIRRLTRKITQSDEFADLSVAVFVLMGAPPVAVRGLYTEPFFAWFSFDGMNACHDKRFLTASFYFALATCFRANGILLPGFILYGLVIQPVLLEFVSTLRETPRTLTGISKSLLQSTRRLRIGAVLYGLVLTALSMMPFIAQQYMGYVAFCSNSSAAPSAVHPRPWCSARLPLIYSFVQSHYWDIGFLRYWTLAQIPNFLLAIPMLTLVSFSSGYLLRIGFQQVFGLGRCGEQDNTSPSTALELSLSTSKMLVLLPYAVHALALSFVLFTAAHVQIALRFLPAASPWAAWAGAALVISGATGNSTARHRDSDNTTMAKHNAYISPGFCWWPLVSHLWIGWSIIWLFVSCALWLAFLPPA